MKAKTSKPGITREDGANATCVFTENNGLRDANAALRREIRELLIDKDRALGRVEKLLEVLMMLGDLERRHKHERHNDPDPF